LKSEAIEVQKTPFRGTETLSSKRRLAGCFQVALYTNPDQAIHENEADPNHKRRLVA